MTWSSPQRLQLYMHLPACWLDEHTDVVLSYQQSNAHTVNIRACARREQVKGRSQRVVLHHWCTTRERDKSAANGSKYRIMQPTQNADVRVRTL